ncbi:MAG: transporter [Sphingomonas sp.]
MRPLLPLLLLAAGTTAQAQALRPLCSERPGIGTPACTIDAGRLQVETGLADWTLDRRADTRTDTILLADTLLRYGATPRLELRLGWTPLGHVRERDRQTGETARNQRAGDVTVGLKRNLANPDGGGFSLALLPFASLPVGRAPVGAGDWGAGLLVPLTYEISDHIQIEFTPEVDAAVDDDGRGRHLAWSGIVGIADTLGKTLMTALEYQHLRDRDPSGHATQNFAAVSLAWHPDERFQLDIGSNVGLDRRSADLELYFGVTRKF